jgi:hypothetical protein
MALRQYLGLTVVLCLLVSEVLLATQLYPQFSPATSSGNEVFSVSTGSAKLIPHAEVNVRNSSSKILGGLLLMSARRLQELGVSMYDVRYDVDVPLRSDLGLTYSIFASNMDTNASSTYIRLEITNNTNTIILSYNVGLVEADRIPETTAPSYSYAFYQVGSEVNTWVNGERNIYQDIIDKSIEVDGEKWRVGKVIFGFLSYSSESGDSNFYSCVFDLNQTSLFYENTMSTRIVSTPPIFSQTVAAAMVMVAFLILLTVMIVYRMGRISKAISMPSTYTEENHLRMFVI